MNAGTKPNVYMSERFTNPEDQLAQGRRENFTWAGVLAIVAAILLLVLLALQYMEYAAVSVA